MKKILSFMFWFTTIMHITAAVSAAYASNWMALGWIVAATLWMADSFRSSSRADRLYRELIEALEECAKVHFDCFKLTIENFGLETKNRLLEKDYNQRHIRRKMHFDRLRKSCKRSKGEKR